MSQQEDLFSNDHEALGQLLDNLDKIPSEELQNK